MRIRPIVAIAARDLRSELKGRAGLGLPIISMALLLPIALIGGTPDVVDTHAVRGDVPEAVLNHPKTHKGRSGTGFRLVNDVVTVYAYRVPPLIRELLDDDSPAVFVEELHPPTRMPGRSLLLALVSASTLTGAVSTSVGGERARHTLQALLSAAVTRLEVVLGKWLAWTGFGTLGALIASTGAMLSGRMEPGLWVLAMPIVPALTVALGLWLVRRTEDVVAGTSVSLRVMPAVLGGTGLLSWILSSFTDLGAAVVPLGGALMVAGDLWQGELLPTAVALLTSVAMTAGLLVATARDLDEHPAKVSTHRVRPWTAVPDGLLVGSLWASLLPGPVLWGWAGNPDMTELLKPERGLLAGGMMLLTLAAVRAVRVMDPAELPSLGRPDWRVLPTALVVFASFQLPGLTSPNPWLQLVAERLHAGMAPFGWMLLLVVGAQELWFRGWMQRRAGWVPAALAWTLTIAPFHPLAGLASGLALGWCAQRGVGNAFAARLLGLLLVWLTTA